MTSRVRKKILAPDAEMETYNPELGISSVTMSLGSKPKLLFLFQWFAVLMGLASAVAALAVAGLSFGCYGAAMVLGRIRPLRDAYEYLSRAYDRVLDRMGQEVLRDSRDTPALRLMVSLSLTVVPIFVVQLVLGKPWLLLAIAFYLSLYGLKFQRFVRMFSASHLEAHMSRPTQLRNVPIEIPQEEFEVAAEDFVVFPRKVALGPVRLQMAGAEHSHKPLELETVKRKVESDRQQQPRFP